MKFFSQVARRYIRACMVNDLSKITEVEYTPEHNLVEIETDDGAGVVLHVFDPRDRDNRETGESSEEFVARCARRRQAAQTNTDTATI